MIALYASGLLWACGYLVHLVHPAFSSDALPLVSGFAELPYLVGGLVGYFVSALVYGKVGARSVGFLSWLGCAFMVVGVVVLVLPAGTRGIDDLVVACSAVAGGGMSLCATMWGVLLARTESGELEKTALSWCPTYVIVVLVVSAASASPRLFRSVALVLFVALPVASQLGFAASMHMLRREAPAPAGDMEQEKGPGHHAPVYVEALAPSGKVTAGQTPSARSFALLLNLLCAFLSLSLIWGVLSHLYGGSFGLILFFFAGGAVLLWGVLWIALRFTKRFGLSTLYRWALPLTVTGVAVASLGSAPMLAVAFIMVLVVNLGFDVVTKLYFVYFAKRWPGHEALAVALGMASVNLAGLAGTFLWNVVQPLLADYGFSAIMLIALIPFVFSVAVALGNDPAPLDGSSASSEARGDGAALSDDAASKGAALGDMLAERYGLTRREAEVVSLLAQGRSRTAVREMLYISKGTVDTHAYHAYAKMGIKTKDELMKLVDELR